VHPARSSHPSRFRARKAGEDRWTPPSQEQWLGVLRSVSIGRDLLFWKKPEFVASGIGGDYVAVQHLSNCFADAQRELEAAAAVCFEAHTRARREGRPDSAMAALQRPGRSTSLTNHVAARSRDSRLSGR
jgi:hypothetical protein